jgi:glycosyltransferase involved in cell wall biosynthesis
MKKIYTAVFRPWNSQYSWFRRDSGLVTEGLRQIGIGSRLVILNADGMPNDERFYPATRDQFVDPKFWACLRLDAIILQGGCDVGIESVSMAIKESGTKLLLRLDTDGILAPQVDLYLYFYTLWWWLGYNKRHPALSRALAKTTLKMVFPLRFGPGRIIRRLRLGDFLLAESRIAVARIQRILNDFGENYSKDKVVNLPIPITTDWHYDLSVPKENLIISVGRWEDTQKDAPKLIKTLGKVLPQFPKYNSVVIGNSEDYLRKLVKKYALASADRIEITGYLPHFEIPAYARRAKIFVCSSRSESMHISSAEALCSGCSVVGPAEIASMQEYSSHCSGTLAWTRRTADFSDALAAEINSWNEGMRNPCEISRFFQSRLAPEKVAREILKTIEQKIS